jgi:hypothetical protein
MLVLRGKWVPKAGFERLGQLKHLRFLSVNRTGMTDANLQPLQNLSSLEELNLLENPISDGGLEHLQVLKSLRVLRSMRGYVTHRAWQN